MKKFFRLHKPLIIAVIGLLVIMGLAKSLYRWVSEGNEPKALPTPVQTVRVKEASMPTLIETVGSLTALKEVKLKATVAGRVGKKLVESGSFVKGGTELLTMVGGPEVRAPYDGYLNDWQVNVGEYVTAGSDLVEFVDTDILSLTYRVPELYAPLLDLAQLVHIRVRAFPDKDFIGKVRFIAPTVDKKTYTILVRAEVDNTSQILWPGMSANVRHILAEKPNALVVPESSLILTLEGYELFVVDQGKLVKRSVTVGSRSKGRVEILSGVKLSEPVLLTLNDTIEEGSLVKAEDWQGEW